MPALPRNTYRTQHGFLFRISVPKDIRPTIGKREIKKALGRDFRAAVSEAHLMSVRVDKLFADARAQPGAKEAPDEPLQAFLKRPVDRRLKTISEVTPELIAGLKSLWFAGLDADIAWRQEGIDDDEYDDLNYNISESKAVLSRALVRGDTDQFLPAVHNLLYGRGYELLVDPTEERRLVYELLSAYQESYDVLEQRQAGRAVKSPTVEVAPLKAAWEEESTCASGLSWAELFEHWRDDRERPAKTVADVEAYLASLQICLPKATPSNLSRSDVTAWLRNERDTRGNKAKTLEKKGTLVGALFSVAVKDELLEKNPFSGFDYSRFAMKEGVADDEDREPFSVEQLKSIFSDSEGIPSIDRTVGGGGYHARLWISLIALLSGARLDEICSLNVVDVKRTPIPHFCIQRAKNQSSVRDVPIHPLLIELGFLQYVDDVRRAKHDKLWPNLTTRSKNASDSDLLSKWFNRFIHATLSMPSTVVFHSFRHTFKDMCRDALIPREVHHAITGHSDDRGVKNVGDSYGRGVSLEVKFAQLSKIRLPFSVSTPRKFKSVS